VRPMMLTSKPPSLRTKCPTTSMRKKFWRLMNKSYTRELR
jgi:hypothetical protein